MGSVRLKDVRCDPRTDMALIECIASYDDNREGDGCYHAQVRCRNDQRVTNVSATVSNTLDSTSHTVNISWMQNATVNEPSSFEVECYNDRHSTAILVSNKSSSAKLEGLLSSSSYICCVSAVYEDYTAKQICAELNTNTLKNISESVETDSESPNLCNESLPQASNSAVNTVGGILGFIIVVLLVLLILCVIALVCLLRPDLKKKVLRER